MILTAQGLPPDLFNLICLPLTFSGRMKFVDFGTCKDLLSPDLNGQEFVGTAEYMSPEVVESKPSGPETDLWSLGVVVYQMMAGYTPFLASSPYLSFLRIKRGFLRLPSFLDEPTKELISLLIHKDPKERLHHAATMEPPTLPPSAVTPSEQGPKAVFSYDKLRALAYFRTDPSFIFPDPLDKSQEIMRVPSLRDIAMRAVGRACLVVAEKIAINGGSKVGLETWIQVDLSSSLPPSLTHSPLGLHPHEAHRAD
jgi:serine/threonine protein kinase